jgi:nucleotide-binding universal stress UspA family protein
MKAILAITDFSASSVNAMHYAADLACSANANLVLLHAIHFPVAVSEISVPGDFIDDMLDAGQRSMEELQESLQSRTKGKIKITTEIRIGDIEHEIKNISPKERLLAMVMGIRSGKSLERALKGSTVHYMMTHAEFPVLIIPEQVRFREIRNIGMACDLKKMEGQLPFETIKEWLSLNSSSLDIIHIDAGNKNPDAAMTAESITIQNHLHTFKPRFHFLKGDGISEVLDGFVKTHPLDLLMVFPRKHGLLGFVHKSKSNLIATHQQLPILSIHETGY